MFDRLLVDRPKCDSGAPRLGPLLSLKKATVKETVAFSRFPSVRDPQDLHERHKLGAQIDS
jgi:hypothetical protein